MSDQRLIRRIAGTDPYPDSRPLPAELSSVDAAFARFTAMERDDSGTRRDPTHRYRSRGRMLSRPLAVAAAFLAVLAIGAMLFALTRPRASGPADTPPTQLPAPTTIPPISEDPPEDDQASAAAPEDDVAIAEAAVRAWYAGEREAIDRLLAPAIRRWGWTDEMVQDHLAYEAAFSGRAGPLTCFPPQEAGATFRCRYAYLNAATDALGLETSLIESIEFRVGGGAVVEWELTDHQFVNTSILTYLNYAGAEGDLESYTSCWSPAFNLECAQIQLRHLDDWIEWNRGDRVAAAREIVGTWATGDCRFAGSIAFCGHAAQYNEVLTGVTNLDGCRSRGAIEVVCTVTYANAISQAVGADATSRTITVVFDVADAAVGSTIEGIDIVGLPRVDIALLDSIETWAAEIGTVEDLTAACGSPIDQTEACASFLLPRLDAWSEWYLGSTGALP